MKSDDLKYIVKEKYSQIAKQENASCGCVSGCCSPSVNFNMFSDNYNLLKGYNPDADFSLGCGLPTEFAQIKEGDTVVDLGSGAGNDCFVAHALVGEKGRVIGIDMTEEMIKKANQNVARLGYKNIDFVLGDIEKMPLEDAIADVVVSNCVLNLVPDKTKAFSEIVRILKPKGHLSVSDIVIIGKLPDKIQKAGEMYAGCVSGAIDKTEYLNIMKDVGFADVAIKKDKKIDLPDEILIKYISQEEIIRFRESNSGIFSITVYAAKPICGCKSGCC